MTEPTGPTQVGSAHALEGVVVVDFTHTLAGPLCTQFLADAGAAVVKVEPPGGEFSRVRGIKRTVDGVELSSYSSAVNRGKQSIVLDLKNEEGLGVARRLIGAADVVIENYAPGAMTRMGLDLTELRAAHPALVTVSISLFGGYEYAGDLANRGGLAIVAEAESGITHESRGPDGNPTRVPVVALGDMATGFAAYGGVVTALLERERTGSGRHVEITMVRTLMALNSIAVTTEQILRTSDAPLRHNRAGGYGTFVTADGHVVIGATTDRLFARLAEAMSRSDLMEDPRFATYRMRDLHIDEIDEIVTSWTSTLPTSEIVDVLSAAMVPVGNVRSTAGLLESDDIARLGYLETVDTGDSLGIRVPQNPVGFRQSRNVIPAAGENTEAVLSALLGCDPAAVGRLRDAGAFGSSENS